MNKTLLPKMPKPREPSQAFELKYHHLEQRTVYTTGKMQVLKEGLLTVSKTDAHGVINHVNRILTEVSGFEEQELLQMPHCIFRHPDMPAEVFEKMWNKLNNGEDWHGYLKNLCKNGNYFWINAHISATIVNDHIIGYTCVGRAVSDKTIYQFDALYAEMLRREALTIPIQQTIKPTEKKRGLFGWKK